MLRKKLTCLKFTKGCSLNTLLTEFKQCVYELKAAGGKLESNAIVSQLLAAIPESYMSVTTAIDVMFAQDKDSITLDFVKNRLLLEESRKDSKEEASQSSAFADRFKKKWKITRKI